MSVARPTKVELSAAPIDGTAAQADSLILRLDHLAVAVPDLEAAIRWYQRCLGFRLLERRETRGETTGMRSAVMRAGDAIVVLVQGTEAQSQVSRFIEHFGAGVHHAAFQVRNIRAALDRVEAMGSRAITDIMGDVGIQQVFLERSSDSAVLVELIETSGGTFSDRTVEELFRTLESRGLY